VKKLMLLGALAAILMLAFAGVALAKDIQCTSVTCNGTRHADTFLERVGNGLEDNIHGRGGKDVEDANGSSGDTDNLFGGRGNDTLKATDTDGNDTLNGGKGTDTCTGNADDTFISCEL
jgi:Ca2+-binding RTX toxin-like protein